MHGRPGEPPGGGPSLLSVKDVKHLDSQVYAMGGVFGSVQCSNKAFMGCIKEGPPCKAFNPPKPWEGGPKAEVVRFGVGSPTNALFQHDISKCKYRMNDVLQ